MPVETPHNKFFIGPLLDASHFSVFFILFLGLFLIVHLKKNLQSARFISLFVCSTLVLTVEAIQPLTGRSGSAPDILNGCLGVLVGYLFLILWNSRTRWVERAIYVFIVVSIQSLLFIPAYRGFEAIVFRATQIPLISNFETSEQILLWEPIGTTSSISITKIFSESADHSMQVQTSSGSWSGVKYDAAATDWSSFEFFEFWIHNPDPQEFDLYIRIDDEDSNGSFEDRYNQKLSIPSGPQLIRIPMKEIELGSGDRKLALSNISKVFFSTHPEDEKRVFYLDSIRLN